MKLELELEHVPLTPPVGISPEPLFLKHCLTICLLWVNGPIYTHIVSSLRETFPLVAFTIIKPLQAGGNKWSSLSSKLCYLLLNHSLTVHMHTGL